MKISKNTTILLIVMISIHHQLLAQCSGDNTFTGATDTDWHTASNWSSNCVPTSPVTGQLTISSNCTITTGSYTVSGHLQIDDGVSLTSSGSSSILVTGTLSGEGTFVGVLDINGDIVPGDITAPPMGFTCGDPLVYAGQSYATVQIGGQCWMAENLNIGTMIIGSSNQTNNSTLEKYCYNDDLANCTTYGGLYQWDEMMQYSTIESTQGICPTGWHLPSDDEYKTLEMTLGMTQAEADATGFRGTDQGSQLADNEPLWLDGSLDMNAAFGNSGFAALPSGNRSAGGSFDGQSVVAGCWSSSESGTGAWSRALSYDSPQVYRSVVNLANGVSVRCVQDD